MQRQALLGADGAKSRAESLCIFRRHRCGPQAHFLVVDVGPGGDQGAVTPGSTETRASWGRTFSRPGADCPRGPSPGMVTDSDGKTGRPPGQADWKKAVESVIAG